MNKAVVEGKKAVAVSRERSAVSLGDVPLIKEMLWAAANLANAEEHAEQSFLETKDEVFAEMAVAIAEERAVVQKKIFGRFFLGTGENKCFFKHLLLAFKRLKEVGTKFYRKALEEKNAVWKKELLDESIEFNERGEHILQILVYFANDARGVFDEFKKPHKKLEEFSPAELEALSHDLEEK